MINRTEMTETRHDLERPIADATIALGYHDKPCAAAGLTSYRVRGRYGWIMIGARSTDDAWREARRSTPEPSDLQVWNGSAYVPA